MGNRIVCAKNELLRSFRHGGLCCWLAAAAATVESCIQGSGSGRK